VPGRARSAARFADEHGLSISVAVLVRTAIRTTARVALEAVLR
jgi:hypothetical protein